MLASFHNEHLVLEYQSQSHWREHEESHLDRELVRVVQINPWKKAARPQLGCKLGSVLQNDVILLRLA
jgi:hypothetical protein